MPDLISFRSQNDSAHLQLDVCVHLPDGSTLVESFSGIGQTLKLALGDAFDNFSRASFHVLLRAFFAGDHEVTEEKWQLPSGEFTALIGDATFRGQPPGGEDLVNWFEPFARATQQTPLNPTGTHWIRLYYAQHNAQMVACEVLLTTSLGHRYNSS